MPAPRTPSRVAAVRCGFAGKPAADGTALGILHRTDRPLARPEPAAEPAETAERRVTEAFDAVADRLLGLSASLRADGKEDQADIMEVTALLAQDPDLRSRAVAGARRGTAAAAAVREAAEAYATVIGSLSDPTLAERATDVRQVGRRVLAELSGSTLPPPGQPLVLVAHEIGAADLLEPGRTVVAAASVTGGPNGHAAIVARSLGIPLLLDVDPALTELPDGEQLLVDASASLAVSRPEPSERAAALAAMDAARARREAVAAQRHLPPETVDGHRMVLNANVATAAEAGAALEANADGVGLLRTELPFLTARSWPTRAQHTAALAPVLRRLGGGAVTVRTLDFADDKLPPFLVGERPEGQALGRGLPLMLAAPEAFGDQFRALLEAARTDAGPTRKDAGPTRRDAGPKAGGGAAPDLRIMIPMVADVSELHACRGILYRTAAELGVEAPPLGVMVELPEAVAAADELARTAAFLSIGSNDLTCQLLGLDRRDPSATPALAAHPRVLEAIGQVVNAARRHHRSVSVCGDAAAHPLVTPLLIGLGVDALSVASGALDEVRARVRGLARDDCAALAAEALTLSTAEEVWALVRRDCP